jgi:hypothetical protein
MAGDGLKRLAENVETVTGVTFQTAEWREMD